MKSLNAQDRSSGHFEIYITKFRGKKDVKVPDLSTSRRRRRPGGGDGGKETENIPTIYSLLMTNDGRASHCASLSFLPSFRIGLLVISMMALLLHCCSDRRRRRRLRERDTEVVKINLWRWQQQLSLRRHLHLHGLVGELVVNGDELVAYRK